MISNQNVLGQYLKKLRKSYGYTQEYVASQLNIIHQTYSHYETGRIIPPSDSLFNLAKLYSIPIEILMKLTVSYEVDSAYIISAHNSIKTDNEITDFLEYVNMPVNQRKLKNLNRREKELLYYFQQLSFDNQDELLDIVKIKCHYQKQKVRST